ncbi:MAG: DNA-binding protein, partial [Culturomica sp.]|nr:DNA-binding protein [Culturomica sp.]
MPINYVLSQKGNPLKPEEPKKWYATAKSTGELTLKKLSQEIAEGSTTVS